MSDTLKKRVARLEENHQIGGDWRQFGNDPRDMPDWALEMAVREEADQLLKLAEERQPSSKEVADARAALEAGEFKQAIELILKLRRHGRPAP